MKEGKDRLRWKYQTDSNMVRMMLEARKRIFDVTRHSETGAPEGHCPFCTMAWDCLIDDPDCNKCPVSPFNNGIGLTCVAFGEVWCRDWDDVLEID